MGKNSRYRWVTTVSEDGLKQWTRLEVGGEPVFTADDARPTDATLDLTTMKKDELVALAGERGLDTTGTKAELLERLQA